MNSSFNRHTLVWIRPECRSVVAAQVSDDELRRYAEAWLAADRPLVVARKMMDKDIPNVGAGHAREQKDNRGHGPLLQLEPFSMGNGIADPIAVGLALPPALGKRRVAFSVDPGDIARYTPPLLLAEAVAQAPAAWQPVLAELHDAAINIGIELRVFGSLAWQALSGIQYLTPQSDIDLLWHPQSHAQLRQGIALLARWERSGGLRADGEVLFGGSGAVSWREWAALKSGGDQRVLVKRAFSAELVAAGELLELLA